MIRRRPASDSKPIIVTVVEPTHYRKESKPNHGNRLWRFSIWVTATIFVLLLVVVANYLDSISSPDDHYGPNNSDPKSPLNTRRDMAADKVKSKFKSKNKSKIKSNTTIPFIPFDTVDIKAIKERFDYAASHGDADNPNNPNNTVGQFLLDFGIIGFPKCGTTTMMKWLNMHEDIAVLGKENMALQKRHPVQIIRNIKNFLPEGRYRRGYKSPNDVEDGRARNKLRIHYPKTKLLVGIRHPVLWFESFYNHRVQNGLPMPDLAKFASQANGKDTTSHCRSTWNGVCMQRAKFHFSLASWGKTPLLSSSKEDYQSYYDAGYDFDNEWKSFSNKDKKQLLRHFNETEISPNPIFLYDVSQLHIPSGNGKKEKQRQKHYNDFVLSLQDFLGVSRNVTAMPSMIRESPGRREGVNATEQARRNKLKIDICEDKYKSPRKWLIEIGANSAEWITSYFAKSPHGVFLGGDVGDKGDGSSRLLEILKSYGEDPCPERRKEQKAK